MITVIPAERRYYSDFGWLKTHWLFSFSDYYDPANIQFGALRVFNDDIVAPGTGFPMHPHKEMEIVTVVLEGEITHRDDLGNSSTIKAHEVQRMSAGTGIHHSEFNLGKVPVHFFQIWILPDQPGLNPSYDQHTFQPGSWYNVFFPVASGAGHKGAVSFHTDATIYLAQIGESHSLPYLCEDSRKVFIYPFEGDLSVNGSALQACDQARVDLEPSLEVQAGKKGCSLILIDVPSCKGFGYDRNTLKGSRG
jgi:quercetin 2,3-dioxygenase